MDAPDLLRAEAHRDELGQPPVLADDTQRAVRGVHQADRGLDDPPQRGLQVQAGADDHDRFEQAAHPVPGLQHGLQPYLKLGEEFIELQAQQHGTARVTLFHRTSSPA